MKATISLGAGDNLFTSHKVRDKRALDHPFCSGVSELKIHFASVMLCIAEFSSGKAPFPGGKDSGNGGSQGSLQLATASLTEKVQIIESF